MPGIFDVIQIADGSARPDAATHRRTSSGGPAAAALCWRRPCSSSSRGGRACCSPRRASWPAWARRCTRRPWRSWRPWRSGGPAAPPQAPPQPQAYQSPPDLMSLYGQLVQRQQANESFNRGAGLLAASMYPGRRPDLIMNAMSGQTQDPARS